MVRENPLITIGIPCYNEVQFIATTINSALCQEYGNIEIVVTDNCSNDGTLEILDSYEKLYGDKLRIIRNESNLGVLKNFHNALDQAKGEYFMWLGGHDIIHPQIIQLAVEVFLRDRNASLVYHQHQFIDANGDYMATPELNDISSGDLNKIQAAIHVYKRLRHCTHIHGLFPTNFREQLPFYAGIGPDHLMLFAFALKGPIYEIYKPYYLRREIKVETDDVRHKRYQEYGMSVVSNDPKYDLYKEHLRFIFKNNIVNLWTKVHLFAVFFLKERKMYRNRFIKEIIRGLI